MPLHNFCQRFLQAGQTPRALFGKDNGIFDPDSAFSLNINTGLNAEDHALFQDHIASAVNIRKFVDLQSDAVTETMRKVFTITPGLNIFTDHRVQLPAALIPRYCASCTTV